MALAYLERSKISCGTRTGCGSGTETPKVLTASERPAPALFSGEISANVFRPSNALDKRSHPTDGGPEIDWLQTGPVEGFLVIPL